MNATILPEKKKHYPVLLNEIISIITPQYGGTFIDCTFGQGGYTKKILEYPKTKVIAFDRDLKSVKVSSNLEKKFGNRFVFKNKKFSHLNELKLNNENIKSIIFSTGLSDNETLIVSPIPSNNNAPKPIDDLILPGRKLPASVIPRCNG